MNEEHPPKRIKIDFDPIPVLSFILDWLEQKSNQTTSNLALTCKVLRGQRNIRTNPRDVRIHNLEFFESLGKCRYSLCYAAADNGDLDLLNSIFLENGLITLNLFKHICHRAVWTDDLKLYSWGLIHKPGYVIHRTNSWLPLALNRSSVNILDLIASEANLVVAEYEPQTLKTYLWVQEKWPKVIENIPHQAIPDYDLDLLDHLRLVGWSIPYQEIYKDSGRTIPKVTQWVQRFADVELRFNFKKLIIAHPESFRQICAYHGENIYSFRDLGSYSGISGKSLTSRTYIAIETKTLPVWEFYRACQIAQPLALLKDIQPRNAIEGFVDWRDDDALFTLEQIQFICSRHLFPGDLSDLFVEAVQKSPVEICIYLYEHHAEQCVPFWPVAWSELEADALVAKWEWIHSIVPLEDPMLFLRHCIMVNCAASFRWVVERLDPAHYETCMALLKDHNENPNRDEPFSFIDFVMILYPKYPHFELTTHYVDEKEHIELIIRLKIPRSSTWQPFWPDDFEFFIKNRSHFQFSRTLRSVLSKRWSEANYQRFLAIEQLLQ